MISLEDKTKDEIIVILSKNSDKENDLLLDFLDIYNLNCLRDASIQQLKEYLKNKLN